MALNFIQFAVILFVAFGSLAYGYCAGIISTTLGQPTFIQYFGLDTRTDSTSYISALVVGFQCGGVIGALAAPYFADKYGRKVILYISSAAVIVTSALQAGSVRLEMFLAFRTLGGVAVGGILVAVPLFQSEIAPANLRGALVAMHGMMLALGYVISSWFSLAFYYTGGQVSWRTPLSLQVVFPLVLVVGLFWLPESPRWLVSRQRHEEARAILRRLHFDPKVVDSNGLVDAEMRSILEQEQIEKTLAVGWASIIQVPSYRRRAILSFLSLFLYSSTGTLTITNYLPSLLGRLNFGASQQLALAGGYITYAPLGNIVASQLLDRIGRRKMFIIGLTGCGLALIGETVAIERGLGTKAGQAFGVTFFFVHLFFFATFLDSTTFVYAAEIWPNHLRAKGFSVGICGLFSGAVIWLGAAPTAFDTIDAYFYIVFIVICFLMIGMIYCFWPETARVPLENIGRLFGDAIVNENDELVVKHEAQHIEHVGQAGQATPSDKDRASV
ncbi:hypothetical protein JCM10207_003287 [Rhodosporidiobolus poonsookiae]